MILHTTKSAEMPKFWLRCYTQSIIQDGHLCLKLVVWQLCILRRWNPWNWFRQWYAVNSCNLLPTHSCGCCQLPTMWKKKRPTIFQIHRKCLPSITTVCVETLQHCSSSLVVYLKLLSLLPQLPTTVQCTLTLPMMQIQSLNRGNTTVTLS